MSEYIFPNYLIIFTVLHKLTSKKVQIVRLVDIPLKILCIYRFLSLSPSFCVCVCLSVYLYLYISLFSQTGICLLFIAPNQICSGELPNLDFFKMYLHDVVYITLLLCPLYFLSIGSCRKRLGQITVWNVDKNTSQGAYSIWNGT